MVTTTDLAISLLQLAAQDQRKQACVHVEGDAVASGHRSEHRFEAVRSIVPFE